MESPRVGSDDPYLLKETAVVYRGLVEHFQSLPKDVVDNVCFSASFVKWWED